MYSIYLIAARKLWDEVMEKHGARDTALPARAAALSLTRRMREQDQGVV